MRIFGVVAVAATLAASPVRAECVFPVDQFRQRVLTGHGTWTAMTPNQLLIAMGMFYASPPVTGMPIGDHGVVISYEDQHVLAFINGDKVCGMLPIDGDALKALTAAALGKFRKPGEAL